VLMPRGSALTAGLAREAADMAGSG
jgi:hypothetical protein